MPEEINRLVTDAVAELLFVTEASAIENLAREGIDAARDSLRRQRHGSTRSSPIAPRPRRATWSSGSASGPGEYAVLTLHRPANVDEPAALHGNSGVPCESRTAGCRSSFRCIHGPDGRTGRARTAPRCRGAGVRVLDPLRLPGLRPADERRAARSHGQRRHPGGNDDSGVPCVTIRENTERSGDGHARHQPAGRHIVRRDTTHDRVRHSTLKKKIVPPPPLWDGRAAARIADVVRARGTPPVKLGSPSASPAGPPRRGLRRPRADRCPRDLGLCARPGGGARDGVRRRRADDRPRRHRRESKRGTVEGGPGASRDLGRDASAQRGASEGAERLARGGHENPRGRAVTRARRGLFRLGDVYFRRETVERARSVVDMAMLDRGPWAFLGDDGRIAIGLCRTAIDREPNRFEYRDQLVFLLESNGLHEEALAAMEESARNPPRFRRPPGFHVRVLAARSRGGVLAKRTVGRSRRGSAPFARASLVPEDPRSASRSPRRGGAGFVKRFSRRAPCCTTRRTRFTSGSCSSILGASDEAEAMLGNAVRESVFGPGVADARARMAAKRERWAPALVQLPRVATIPTARRWCAPSIRFRRTKGAGLGSGGRIAALGDPRAPRGAGPAPSASSSCSSPKGKSARAGRSGRVPPGRSTDRGRLKRLQQALTPRVDPTGR